MTSSFRTAGGADLASALQDARQHTLGLLDCYRAAGFDHAPRVPVLPDLNPPLWEFGHIAWVAERYVLRGGAAAEPGEARRASLLTRGDDWFDPNRVEHGARWSLELPRPGAISMYCHEVLDRLLDRLERTADEDAALYPYRLALAYEDLRGEALAAGLQTLGATAPAVLASPVTPGWAQGEIRFPGGTIELGSRRDAGFVFDNEKWAHACHVPAFTMDSTLVSNAQYREFVEDGGYRKRRFWSTAGYDWLASSDALAPRDWERDGRHWCCVRFGRREVLAPHEPVRHLNLYEAQAYCIWAERRLPSEAEWEYAVMSMHPALRWGDLWEWTCSPFEPYPGFAPDGWIDYSTPYFDSHQVLRGASFATALRARSPKYRNFQLPERRSLFAGFRTCAP